MTQKMIFMGAGEDSVSECKKLHERLDEGLEALSGAQQWTPPGKFGSPSGSTMEEWTEGQDKISNEIMAVIGNIASALGAKTHRMDDEMRFLLEIEIPVTPSS